jgi:hypothetical protein
MRPLFFSHQSVPESWGTPLNSDAIEPQSGKKDNTRVEKGGIRNVNHETRRG